jgi:hypothetical protein
LVLQRKMSDARSLEKREAFATARVDEALDSPGQSLDAATRAEMESRFGHDFANVRVHADATAADAARAVNALAYTLGNDIVFGAGAYEPNTQAGKRLLAHELTHVVQQGNTQGVTTRRLANAALTLSQPSDRAEQEASRGAEAIMCGMSFAPAATSAPGSGATIQRQPAAPAKTVEKSEEKPGATEAKATEKGGEAETSTLRQKLLELFGRFEKSVIGDEVFDKVETQKAWDVQKSEEAVASLIYASEKKDYEAAHKTWVDGGKKGPEPKPPVPVAKFTTCIATQQVILTQAFKETGLAIKKHGKLSKYAFATQGAEVAEAIAPADAAGPGAWHWGRMGMGEKERPKPGDIIVMAFRGGTVDKGAKELNYLLNIKYGTAQKVKTNEEAKAKLKASGEAIAKAQESLEDLQRNPKAANWQLRAAQARLERAINALNAAKNAADKAASDVENLKKPTPEERAPAEAKLEAARKESAAARAERLKEPVGSKKRYMFQFSHVGFLQKIERLTDGREKWTTFDGGQLVEREGKKVEGAQTSIRYYDPKSNEISGELQQGGEARWLYGWVDVDKLVKPKQ